jgi:hypothetical protein
MILTERREKIFTFGKILTQGKIFFMLEKNIYGEKYVRWKIKFTS